MKRLWFVLLIPFLLAGGQAWADTHTVTGCTQANVVAAITDASAGDTVAVGAGNCSWSAVSISGKALTLQGAGQGVTNITLTANSALSISPTTTNFVTVRDFTFIDGSSGNEPQFTISGPVMSEYIGFRVTATTHTGCYPHCIGVTGVYGLIDHNSFTANGTTQIIEVVGDGDTENGSLAWKLPLAFGTGKFVFIEDNTFTASDAYCDGSIDGFNGARAVMRYNTFNSCYPGTHGIDTGSHRSFAHLEIYGNTYNNTHNDVNKRMGTLRGGTALYFNNILGSGTVNNGLTLQYWRMSSYQNGTWGRCNGTNLKMGSDFASASSGGTYMFLSTNRDSYCTSGATCTAYFDGSTANPGYPCRDQPGRGPGGQLLQPIYLWNNSSGLSEAGTYCGGVTDCDMDTGIQQNRDYYNYVSSGFNGTVGVGRGTKATMTAITTCTAGVGYWVTNEGYWNNKTPGTPSGVLYTCRAGNVWTPYYVPYTYPHPFQSGLAAPTGVK